MTKQLLDNLQASLNLDLLAFLPELILCVGIVLLLLLRLLHDDLDDRLLRIVRGCGGLLRLLQRARQRFGGRIRYASSVGECFRQAEICVVALPVEAFRRISAADIVHDPTTIIDCWRILDPTRLGNQVRHVALGRHA